MEAEERAHRAVGPRLLELLGDSRERLERYRGGAAGELVERGAHRLLIVLGRQLPASEHAGLGMCGHKGQKLDEIDAAIANSVGARDHDFGIRCGVGTFTIRRQQLGDVVSRDPTVLVLTC